MPDLAEDTSPRAAAAVAAGLHGIVGFPVRSGRRVVGMISLHTWAARDLDDGLVAVMNDVGSQIGEFVERKRAEVALQESEKRMRSVLDNVSDGLATDAAHIARRSGCRVAIELERVPLAPGATIDDVGFGEDYELLAATPDALGFATIGRCEEGSGVVLTLRGEPVELAGWEHFR